jgi:hypothetical protein
MTTHLHPDGLPITDTPFVTFADEKCNEQDATDSQKARIYRMAAVSLERDKRKAEAQLVVAMRPLENIVRNACEWNTARDICVQALAEIKAIGESK